MKVVLNKRTKKLIIYYDEEETKTILSSAKDYAERGIMWGEVADYGRNTMCDVYRQLKGVLIE